MKATNNFQNVEFKLVLTEGTDVCIKEMTLDRIYNSGMEEGHDYEFIYSLDMYFEDVIKMKVGDSMPFKTERNEPWISLIIRTK